jgi:hypothetical protein
LVAGFESGKRVGRVGKRAIAIQRGQVRKGGDVVGMLEEGVLEDVGFVGAEVEDPARVAVDGGQLSEELAGQCWMVNGRVAGVLAVSHRASASATGMSAAG